MSGFLLASSRSGRGRSFENLRTIALVSMKPQSADLSCKFVLTSEYIPMITRTFNGSDGASVVGTDPRVDEFKLLF